MLRFWKSGLAVQDCPQLGRTNERAPVSVGAVAKVKSWTADLGPRPPLGPGEDPGLEGERSLEDWTPQNS